MPLSKSMSIDGFGWWLHRRHIKASRREFDDGHHLFLRQMEPVHISLTVAPTSRLSNTTETGVRVSRNTHAPLRLPGMLSTEGHCDQSRAGIFSPSVIVAGQAGFCHGF